MLCIFNFTSFTIFFTRKELGFRIEVVDKFCFTSQINFSHAWRITYFNVGSITQHEKKLGLQFSGYHRGMLSAGDNVSTCFYPFVSMHDDQN